MTRQTELMALSQNAGAKEFIFYLDSSAWGQVLLRYAPDRWSESGFKLVRNLKYKGLFRGVSVEELTFVKDGKQYIQNVFETEGVVGDIIFTVYRYDYTTWKYSTTPYFQGKIDLTTYKANNTGVTVQIIDTSFVEKIKSRENVKVDIIPKVTASGIEIISINGSGIAPFADETTASLPELNLAELNVERLAVWTENDTVVSTDDQHYVPMKLINSEFDETQDQEIDDTNPFLLDNQEVATRTMNLSGNLQGSVVADGQLPKITILFRLHHGATSTIVGTASATGIVTRLDFDVDINRTFTLDQNEDAYLEGEVTIGGSTNTTSYEIVNLELREPFESIPAVTITAYLFYELLLRICQLTGDKNDAFQSTFFGRTDTPIITYPSDGQFGHSTKGLYVREAFGLNRTMAVSLTDAFKSLGSVFNLGLGIETISGVERVVVEELEYFFESFIALDISDKIGTGNINKEVLPDWHYNNIKVGYNSFLYEEIGGLSEFNTKSEYTTVIDVIDNVLDLVGKYRADTNGINKLRQTGSTTEDERGDEDIYIIDSVRDGGDWLSRTDEGFVLVEGGVDSDQMFNLDWTPARNLLRHGDVIRAGLHKRLNSYLRWQQTDKNTTLKTQLTGDIIIIENEDIQVENPDPTKPSLEKPLWIPEAYNVEVPFSISDLNTVLANPKQIIKIGTDMYGWILELNMAAKADKAELKLLRVNTERITPVWGYGWAGFGSAFTAGKHTFNSSTWTPLITLRCNDIDSNGNDRRAWLLALGGENIRVTEALNTDNYGEFSVTSAVDFGGTAVQLNIVNTEDNGGGCALGREIEIKPI